MIQPRFIRLAWAALAVGAALGCVGCAGSPTAVNITLRKENQQLHKQIRQLQDQHEQDAALIAGLQRRSPTEKTLPPGELAKLFTTHGISFGRLTGGLQTNPNLPYDQGLKVFMVPIDQMNQPLKAAGGITVEAFDLAADHPRIGEWKFPVEQAAQNWYGYFLIDYYYVLSCPWQTAPQHGDLTIKVTFVDELTKIPFSAQELVHITPPPPSPTTAASAR
jgi:hypothetical protein